MSIAVVEPRVLGQVELRVDGQLVEVGHARQRCVLAVLPTDELQPPDALRLAGRQRRELHQRLGCERDPPIR